MLAVVVIVCVADMLGNCVCVRDGVDEPDWLAVCVWLSVMLGVTVAEGESICVREDVAVPDWLAVAVVLCVREDEGDRDIVSDGVDELEEGTRVTTATTRRTRWLLKSACIEWLNQIV